jgi:copper chaperone
MARSRVWAVVKAQTGESKVGTFDLTLPSMTCGHCVKTVTTAAQRLDPDARVQADLATHRVTVQTTVAREALLEALAHEGYRADA